MMCRTRRRTIVTTNSDDSCLSSSLSSYNSQQPSPKYKRSLADAGLSKLHQRLLQKTPQRQRFVTGKYPVYCAIKDSPTKKWLAQLVATSKPLFPDNKNKSGSRGGSTAQLFVNGTFVEMSAASFERYGWLDDDEKAGDGLSIELIAEIYSRKPAYLNLLPSVDHPHVFENDGSQAGDVDVLWVTDFSIAKPGGLTAIHTENGSIKSIDVPLSWPNEVNRVPLQANEKASDKKSYVARSYEDSVIVTDGFLVPGREDGAIYIVQNPGGPHEWKINLTGSPRLVDVDHAGWFYHRASFVDLTGDGRLSIIAARARRPSLLQSNNKSSTVESRSNSGQLVWFERPKPYKYDEATGTPLDSDGTEFDPYDRKHLPWKMRVLDVGPDVMFSVVDLDPTDDSIEVIASQFFGKKVTLHSIQKGENPKVNFTRIVDDRCGSAFSSILVDLSGVNQQDGSDYPIVIDSGSTVETLKAGDRASHLLVTSHECSIDDEIEDKNENRSPSDEDSYISSISVGDCKSPFGGSLFSYKIPTDWKNQDWKRQIIATGFKVKGQIGNMINPGAPGFCYSFYPTVDGPKVWSRPYLAVAGDCAETMYILRPDNNEHESMYSLMCEIKCGGTVGSLAIGYGQFCGTEAENGWAKIYVPSYEKDRIYVLGLGLGDDSDFV